MQQALIIGLMILGTIAKVLSIVRIAINRMALRYPLFTLMTVLNTARTVVLLTVLGIGRPLLYAPIWQATNGMTIALQAAACVEAFWIVALHFRNIKAFGAILLFLIAAVGTVLGYSLVASWSGKWSSPFTTTMILLQRVGLVLIVIALLSRLFFRQFPTVPVKPNAVRHLGILTLLFTSFVVDGFIANGAAWNFISNFAMALGVLIAYTWWSISMTPEGEKLPFSPPEALSVEDFETADAADRRKMDLAVRVTPGRLP
jgi:hypothetical protein